jgi:hypothetical protein
MEMVALVLPSFLPLLVSLLSSPLRFLSSSPLA